MIIQLQQSSESCHTLSVIEQMQLTVSGGGVLGCLDRTVEFSKTFAAIRVKNEASGCSTTLDFRKKGF
jgi:hypothetical protein